MRNESTECESSEFSCDGNFEEMKSQVSKKGKAFFGNYECRNITLFPNDYFIAKEGKR